MAKVIIRSEVNALGIEKFLDDLNKAVLYGEISGDPRFVVSSINSVSNQPYTEMQALLEADIQVASSQITVELTPRQNTVLSTGTSLIFDITTAGTITVGTPVWSVVTATVGGVNATTSLTGSELTLTFPANSSYDPKSIVAQVKVAIDGDEFVSNQATATQNAAGQLVFDPISGTVHSTATTKSATYVTNCTNVGLYSQTNLTSSSITTNTKTVTMGFPMNQDTSGPVTRTVTISGTTPDNTTIYATYTLSQSTALNTGMILNYNGGTVGPESGSTSAFTITLTNATLTSVTVPAGCTYTTGGTATNPTLRVTYPANTGSDPKSYNITVVATDIYGNPITKTVTIPQASDTYSFSLSAPDVSASVTANTVTITSTGVNDIGWDQAHSSGINSCVVNGGQATVTFPQNQGGTPVEYTVCLTGRTAGGQIVSATTTFTQEAFSYAFTITPASGTVGGNVTSDPFTYTITNVVPSSVGYYAAGSSNVSSCSVNTTNKNGTVSFSVNPSYTDQRQIVLALTGTTTVGTPVTATTTINQEGQGYNPSISPATTAVTLPAYVEGVYDGSDVSGSVSFTYVDLSGYTVSKTANIKTVNVTTGGTNTVSFTISQNTTTSAISPVGTITLTGLGLGGTNVTLVITVNQQGGVSTNMVFTYDGTGITASAGSIPASDFTVTLTNAKLSGVSQTGGITVVTGGTVSAPTVRVSSYPANQTDSPKQYTITLTATDIYGRTITKTVTITQAADAYTFSLSADANPISSEATLALFTITSNNISNIGYVSSGSENVVSCTISGGKARATITTNDGGDRTIKVRVSGTTTGGRTVYATGTTTQSAPSSYVFDLTPVGGEMSYVARTATSHQYEITSQNINDETIGYVSAGSTNATGFDYSTQVGTFNANTGGDREITIQISAKTLSNQTVYADATVIQLGNHSETDFISVTPDGTAISAAATSVTFNISWNYAKTGTNITFSVASGITAAPASIAVTSISGSSATTVSVSANGGSSRRPTLTASMTDVVSASHSDSGYYTQATSRSRFEFQDDFDVQWDVTSATITFTYAYLTNNSVSLTATGGAYFNSGLTQPSTSVSITPNASSRSGSVTIYFAKNDASLSNLDYVITATGNHGEAGESTSLNDSITVTHLLPEGASLVLTPCSTTYYWNTANVTFNLDWTNINPGLASNPGITITVTNGATATPNKFYSGDNGDEDFVVSGLAPGNTYTVTVTGKPYVGDNIVRTYTITIPAKPAGGSITVQSDSDYHLDGSAGSNSFYISWTNLMVGSTVSFYGSNGMSNISPSSINITSANASSGNTTVNFNYSALSSGYRDLTLTAEGTDRNGDSVDDDDYYRQHGKGGGTGGSTLVVSAVTSSPVSSTATTVTFKVTWANVWGTINLSSSIGSVSPTSITADGSNNRNVTVTMGANPGPGSRTIVLTGSTQFNSLSDYDSITQSAPVVVYNPDIWWTKTNGGTTEVTSISDVPAYVSGTYDGRNITYTIYINYNSDVTSVSIDDSLFSGTVNRNGKVVTLEVSVNEALSSKSLGSITVRGTAPDGSYDEATLTVTQVAGVSPTMSFRNTPQTVGADTTSVDDILDYNLVDPSSIGRSAMTGNITNVTLS